MADNRIILLKDADILSESMHKINYNFKLLANDAEVNEYRWQQYVKAIDKKIKGLKDASDVKEDSISNELEQLRELFDSMASKEDIQNQVNNAIQNAQGELNDFISQVAGQQISSRLGAYATTSQLYEELGNLDYVRSDAFDTFTAKANEKIASASRIVANSKFAEQDGKLVNIDGTVSAYSSINEVWDSLPATKKAELDPQGKGLSDPEVLERFMNYCETKFKTVYSELTAIRQAVGNGSASVDIVAAVKNALGAGNTGDDAHDIAAAIFLKANEDGSNILMTADHVQIDGRTVGFTADNLGIDVDHILALRGGTFYVDSNNFKVGLDGKIQASGAELEGKIVANEFTTPSGLTWMDGSGALHASNAVIDGTITANSFDANTEVDVNENGITGLLSKNTHMDGESFNINVRGTLTDSNNGTQFVTDYNSLYIKIVNTLPNNIDGKSNEEFNSDYLYGVPVLCMRYNNVEYMLSPASWFTGGSGGGDSSNMRFMSKYDAIHCSFNSDLIVLTASGSTVPNSIRTTNFSLGNGVISTVYLFRNDKTYTVGSQTVPLVSMRNNRGTSTDTVYQFEILNWGDKYNSSTVEMLNSGSYGNRTLPLLGSSYSETVIPTLGAYTLKSILGTNGLKFANSGGVQTVIKDTNRNEMIKYLYYDDYTLAKDLRVDGSYEYVSEVEEDYGTKKIINMILNLLRLNPEYDESGITGVSNLWEINFNNMSGYYDCVFESSESGTYDYNINEYLPFDENGHFFDLGGNDKNYIYNIKYYPVCEIKNYGLTHTGTNQIIVDYTMNIYVKYSDDSKKFPLTIYSPSAAAIVNTPYVQCNIDIFTLKLEFTAVLNLNDIYPLYNPSVSTTNDNIKNLVKYFLENYDYDNIAVNSTNHNNFYRYVKLSGNIIGTVARAAGYSLSSSTVDIRIKSR